MNKRIHITKRNIWRSYVGALMTAVMSFAGVACTIDENIEPEQPSGELQTATFEFSFSAGTPVNRTRAGELAWDDTAVDCVWVGIFIDDERYGEDNGKLIGAESWTMSGTVPGGSHGTGVFSDKVAVSVMFNDAKPPKVRAAGVANFDGILGYKSPTEEAENLAVLLANIKNWDEYMAIAVDAESADQAKYRIMSNLVTFEDNDTHFNYTVNADGTVTSAENNNTGQKGKYYFDLDGYSRNRITGWLHLRRLISHSTVNIKTEENVEVTNLRYQVFNAPTRTYVQERTMEVLETTPKAGSTSWEELTSWEDFFKISPNAADYFSSDTYPGNAAPYYTSFEAADIQGSSFEFSHYDNKHWGLKGGSCEAYAQREEVFDDREIYSSLCTTAEKWYNNYASYFRIYATVTDKTKGITADVVYTIHEGFCNNADLSEYTGTEEGRKARDFMCVRNTNYTYNVTIAGINSIIVSVDSDEPQNAGASGTLTEYVYEVDSDGEYMNNDGEVEVESIVLKLTDAQRSSLKWRLYTPLSDAFELADFGTFDKEEVGEMAAKYHGNWRANDEYSTDFDKDHDFYKDVIFYSGASEIGSLEDFATKVSDDNSALKDYTVKIDEYTAKAKTSSESENFARILYLYADESYSAGGSNYKPLFVFKQYPGDGRGTLSKPEIGSIEFTNSIPASPSAAIATYVESMTATWSESSCDGVSADVYEVYIGENLIATVEDGTLTYTTDYVSTMTAGTYTLGVVAKVADDTLKPSEMAVKEFEIFPKTILWDFSTKKWQTALEAAAPNATNSNNMADWTVSLDGLTYTSGPGDGRWEKTYIQPNGAGDASKRVFSFTAYGPGILKVVASNTGNSANMDRNVTVQLGDDAANAMSKPGGYAAGSQQPIEFYLNITETTTVSIYPTGGLRFYSMEFTYVEQETVWDFSSTEWQAEFKKYGDVNTDIENWNLTFDGLNIYSTAKSKYQPTYFQWGGKGSTSDRYLKFEALTSGKLTVTASNTGGSEDLTRMVTVNQKGTETSQAGGTASDANPSVLTFDVDAGEVLIYCTGNALRFYQVEFDGVVRK